MADAQYLINQIRRTLNDTVDTAEFPYRWSNAELLRWINDGQREIVRYKPEANVVTVLMDVLQQEQIYQELNFDGHENRCYKLIRVEANNVNVETAAPPVPVTPLDAWQYLGEMAFTADGNQSLTYAPPAGASQANNTVTLVLFLSTSQHTDKRRVALQAATYGGVAMQMSTPGGGTVGELPNLTVGTARLYWPGYGTPANSTLTVTGNIYSSQADTVKVYARTFNHVASTIAFVAYQQTFAGDSFLGPAALSTFPVGENDYTLFGLGYSGEYTGGASLSPTIATNINVRYSSGFVAPGTPLDLTTVATEKVADGFYVAYERLNSPNPVVANSPAHTITEPGSVLGMQASVILFGLAAGTPVVTPTMGHIVRMVQQDVIDSFIGVFNTHLPSDQSPSIDYYKVWAPCPRNPRAFYIYPPKSAFADDHGLWVTYSRVPIDLVNTTDELELSDLYLDALRDFVIFRAYLKRARTYSAQAAGAALERFGRQLNLSRAILTAMYPRPSTDGEVVA